MKDKTHSEHVIKWAEFVKTHPINEWKPQVTALVDSQLKMADAFYARLAETHDGRVKIEKLKRAFSARR
ncbi:MAG: hypothetical protein ABIH90_00430 [Candidatus Aenigmatarchaeota archaeon]